MVEHRTLNPLVPSSSLGLPISSKPCTRRGFVLSTFPSLTAIVISKDARLIEFIFQTGCKPFKLVLNEKLATKAIETNSRKYWSDYYVTKLDEVCRSILGIEETRAVRDIQQVRAILIITTSDRLILLQEVY
jgi:hypothetical protein